MRGKIIQYNGADGSGTIVADGRQYHFALTNWRGDSAPGVNRTVELVLDGDAVTAVTAVGEDVLLKEKAAELGGKFGASLNKLRASIPASAGAAVGATGSAAAAQGTAGDGSAGGSAIGVDSVVARYGKSTLGAYAAFLLGTLAFNAVTISMMTVSIGKSLFDIASLMSQIGVNGSGSIKLVLLLAYASIAAPLVWRNRGAWLALLLPLVAVLWAVFSALHALDSLGDGVGSGMADAFSLGFGFYLSLAAALVLAALAVKRGITGS